MVGFVMSAFAPNIYVVIAGYGVMTGLITIYSIATFRLLNETKHKYRDQETFAFECKISELRKNVP